MAGAAEPTGPRWGCWVGERNVEAPTRTAREHSAAKRGGRWRCWGGRSRPLGGGSRVDGGLSRAQTTTRDAFALLSSVREARRVGLFMLFGAGCRLALNERATLLLPELVRLCRSRGWEPKTTSLAEGSAWSTLGERPGRGLRASGRRGTMLEAVAELVVLSRSEVALEALELLSLRLVLSLDF